VTEGSTFDKDRNRNTAELRVRNKERKKKVAKDKGNIDLGKERNT
jgi:hypothetical protein